MRSGGKRRSFPGFCHERGLPDFLGENNLTAGQTERSDIRIMTYEYGALLGMLAGDGTGFGICGKRWERDAGKEEVHRNILYYSLCFFLCTYGHVCTAFRRFAVCAEKFFPESVFPDSGYCYHKKRRGKIFRKTRKSEIFVLSVGGGNGRDSEQFLCGGSSGFGGCFHAE